MKFLLVISILASSTMAFAANCDCEKKIGLAFPGCREQCSGVQGYQDDEPNAEVDLSTPPPEVD